MAKMELTFPGFSDLAERLDKMGNNLLKKAADEALQETVDIVQNNVKAAASPYADGGRKGYATGAMYKSMINKSTVAWRGNVASVDVGFDLSKHGGHHSIFIMHGTKVYGTPRIKKDTKLYNAVRGAKTKEQIYAAQEKAMRKYLTLGG